jgi:hypothetical protein
MQDPAQLPQLPPLPRTPQREATTTLQGYAYQVWVSLDQWLRLPTDGVLFLEGAEDIDRVRIDGTDTIQVRHTRGTISLNTKYAREAIAQFWTTRERELKANGRKVHYTYLTTSNVALESNATFGGRNGITTWENARYETSSAETLRNYLISNLGATGSLRAFLHTANVKDLQQQLFSNFFWATNCPDVTTVQGVVTDRLSTRLSANNFSRATLDQIRDNLFAYCWRKICETCIEDRTLTAPELDRQIQDATTIYLPLPINSMGGVLMAAAHMSSLQGAVHDLSVLAQEIPTPPDPLLNRSQLTVAVATHLRMREAVLLTGSVFKGKTTIAILASIATNPNAWWIDLSERPSSAVRDIFAFLTMVIERRETPELIVLDDLNTSEASKKTYGQSLRKLVYRAKSAGKAILLTAQGSSDAFEKSDAKAWGVAVLDIPSMNETEIQAECINAGCASDLDAPHWARLIFMETAGHPKLVQVRIAELNELGWPVFSPKYFLRTSPAVQGARQIAQSLFSESVSGAEAEYVYAIAEFQVSPSREMLLNLADLSPNIYAADSLIRKLTGKWLETVTENRYRVTPILRAVVGETWSEAKYRLVHRSVFDAIAKCSRLTVRDGASLLFHAVVARDSERTTNSCVELITIGEQKIKEQAYRELSWIVSIGTEDNKSIFPWNKETALLLRNLQFLVGAAEHVERLSLIVQQWKREIAEADASSRSNAETMLNLSILTTPAHLSPKTVLEGATWMRNEGKKGNRSVKMFEQFHSGNDLLELPRTATNFQIYLVIKFNMVANYEDFCELVDWVDHVNSEELLREFDVMMTWPTVMLNGLFLHMGWIAEAKLENANWERWIVELNRAWKTAKRRRMHSFGCEIARALSVIFCEQLSDFDRGYVVLDHALNDFGPSAVLIEQRSNAYFQVQQYLKVLETWEMLVQQFGPDACADPYAFRRTALAAAKLERWGDAAVLFEDGANTLPSNYEMPTRCALLAEAALAMHLDGNRIDASRLITKCFEEIPKSSGIETSVHWEAALRMFGAIASQIRGHQAMMTDGAPVIIKSGMASNPELKIGNTDENHRMRMAMLELEVLIGKAETTSAELGIDNRVVKLLRHEDPIIRWLASISSIAYELETKSTSLFVSLAEISFSSLEDARKRSPYAHLKKSPEAPITGLYLLAAICDPRPINELLSLWETAISEPNFSVSRTVLSAIGKGSRVAPMAAPHLVFNGDSNMLERCGAALSILKSALYDAHSTAGAQALLAMMVQKTGALSSLKGKGIEPLLGQRFAESWQSLVIRPHLCTSPQVTIPPLRIAMQLSLQRTGSVKQLLQCGAAAGGIDIEQIIDTLEF